jgi:hypothetical protein
VRSLLHKDVIKARGISRDECKRETQRSLVSVRMRKGTLWFKDRLVVSRRAAFRKKILDEAHTSRYSIHSDCTKMYHDLSQQFWWTRMKHETVRYVSEYDTC